MPEFAGTRSAILPDLAHRRYRIHDILRGAGTIFRDRAWPILTVALIVYVPILGILYLVPLDQLIAELGTVQGLRTYTNISRLLEAMIGVIGTMAIAVIVEGATKGEAIPARKALRTSVSRWLGAIGTNWLSGLVVAGGILLLVVPGVICIVYFIFATQVVILRKLGGRAALEYSKRLVGGQWWRIFRLALTLWLLGLLAHMTPHIVEFFGRESSVLERVADGAGVVVTAFFAVAHTVFFLNTEAVGGVRTTALG